MQVYKINVFFILGENISVSIEVEGSNNSIFDRGF
jgi:hypothetical protein